MSVLVYSLESGKRVNDCSSRRARILLEQSRAKVINKSPFTIGLLSTISSLSDGNQSIIKEIKMFKKINSKSNAGLTLIEVISGLAIFALVVVAAITLYSSAKTSQSASEVVKNVQAIATANGIVTGEMPDVATALVNGNYLSSAAKNNNTETITVGTTNYQLSSYDGSGSSTTSGSANGIEVSNTSQATCIRAASELAKTYAIGTTAAAAATAGAAGYVGLYNNSGNPLVLGADVCLQSGANIPSKFSVFLGN